MGAGLARNAEVVRIDRLHPFQLWLLNSRPRRSQEWAAGRLGIARVYLTKVLSGKRVPSRELYADMARLSRGGVTIKELEAYRKPSRQARRRKPQPRTAKVAHLEAPKAIQ